ncbi:MAG: hypothetical protein ENTB_04659 [Enterocloster aldenensis]
MEAAIGIRPEEAWKGRDLACVNKEKYEILGVHPDEAVQAKAEKIAVNIVSDVCNTL